MRSKYKKTLPGFPGRAGGWRQTVQSALQQSAYLYKNGGKNQ